VTAMRPGQRLPRHFAQDIVLIHPRARPEGLGLQPHGKDFFRPISPNCRSLQRRYRGDTLKAPSARAAASSTSLTPTEASKSLRLLIVRPIILRPARTIHRECFLQTRVAVSVR